jgi:hypothetical protein
VRCIAASLLLIKSALMRAASARSSIDHARANKRSSEPSSATTSNKDFLSQKCQLTSGTHSVKICMDC